jgi:hypothetical protein
MPSTFTPKSKDREDRKRWDNCQIRLRNPRVDNATAYLNSSKTGQGNLSSRSSGGLNKSHICT